MAGPVSDFIEVADEVLRSVADDFDLPRDGLFGQFIESRRTGDATRGRTPSGLIYAVHGIGCRFRMRYRGVVDLDISPTGAPMFDVWRIRRWAASVGIPEPAEQSVEDEAAELIRSGMVRALGPGWWTSPSW